MRPLAEALAAAGFTVDLPLLPGHGTSLEDMVPTRWDDWSGAAEAHFQALAARCDHVAVAGLSMGGALACWLAERHPHLSGIALVNPMVQPPAVEFRWRGSRPSSTPGSRRSTPSAPTSRRRARSSPPTRGRRWPPCSRCSGGPTRSRPSWPTSTARSCCFSSREDHVVEPVSGDVVEARVSGPVERIWLEDSYHVATLDNDAPLIEARTVAFATALVGGGVADDRPRPPDPRGRRPRGRAGPPAPDRRGARPVHRAAGLGARPRRRRGLPRPRRRGADRPRHGRHQRAAARRAPALPRPRRGAGPGPRRSRTTGSGCPASWARRRDAPRGPPSRPPPWSGPASESAADVLEHHLAVIEAGEEAVHAFNLVLADSARAGPGPSTPGWRPARTPAPWPACPSP